MILNWTCEHESALQMCNLLELMEYDSNMKTIKAVLQHHFSIEAAKTGQTRQKWHY